MHHRTRLGFLVFFLSLAGCASPAHWSNAAFQRAIRGSNSPCEQVVASEALNSSKTTWCVNCAEAATYMAMVQRDGSLCVEPMPVGDFRAGLPLNASRLGCSQ